MKTKYVLFFQTIYPYVTGGMEVYNYHLSKNLLTDKYPDFLMLTTVKQLANYKNIYYAKDNIFGIRRWGLNILSMFVYCIFSSKVNVRTWKHIMIPYTSSFNYCAWPFILFSIIFRFKYSVHCHGGGALPWKTPKLQKMFFDRASHKAAVSDSLRVEYGKRLGYELEYLPPLVEFHKPTQSRIELRKKYKVPLNAKCFLYVGSIKPLKAPEVLLKAFSELSRPNTYLIMAGDGPLRAELQAKYVSSNISFLGNVPNEHICELFSLADIYVIPSWFEGTSVSLLEAMNKSLCCVGSDVQGINSMIQSGINGLLFPKNNIKSLYLIFEKILSDETICIELGKSARKYYEQHYSYKNHISEVLKFLS